jgi:hypothetical protein
MKIFYPTTDTGVVASGKFLTAILTTTRDIKYAKTEIILAATQATRVQRSHMM